MDIALWVIQSVLALVFLMAGGMKLVKSREELVSQQAWVEDFSDVAVKTIGGIEVLAAIGLIFPGLTGIAPELVAWAAVGLAISQTIAFFLHIRRGNETQPMIMNVIFVALSVFVAWGRFGEYPL